MINAKITDIPIPTTRTEHFMYSAITGSESGMKADTQAEMYLEAIKDGDTNDLEELEPRTVLDMYLEARQTGNLDDLPKPRTTSEMLLYQAITGEDLGVKPVSNMDKYLLLLEPNNYDARLEIESEESVIHLTDSKDGVVEIKELEGNTLVNIVSQANIVKNSDDYKHYQINSLIKSNTDYTIITPDSNDVKYRISNHNTSMYLTSWVRGSVKFNTGDNESIRVLYRFIDDNNVVNKNGVLTDEHDKVVLLEGDWTNKEIPPYFEGMKSAGECEGNKIEILSQNKNLFNYEEYYRFFPSTKTSDSTILSHKGDLKGGNHNLDFKSPMKVNLKPNTTYTFCVFNLSDSGQVLSCEGCLSSKNAELGMKIPIGEVGYKVFTTNSTNYKDGISFKLNTSTDGDNAKYKIMLVEGDIRPTNYIHFTQNKKEISLNEPLRGLPNGVRDKIVLKNGKLMIERRIGSYTFTGNEVFNFDPSNHSTWNMYTGNLVNKKLDNSENAYVCNTMKVCHFNHNIDVLTGKNIGSNFVAGFNFQITKTEFGEGKTQAEFTTLFKQWLKDNPTTVLYEKATPTYEEITPELEKLTLTCYDNATLHFKTNIPPKSLISYTANTSNIYKYLDTLKLSKEECDSIINSMKRV